jgi:hypothetical protein
MLSFSCDCIALSKLYKKQVGGQHGSRGRCPSQSRIAVFIGSALTQTTTFCWGQYNQSAGVGIDLRCAHNVYVMVCICSYILYEKTKHG